MNNLSSIIVCIVFLSSSLLSCVGINSPTESVAPIPIGDNSLTSPLLVGDGAISPLAPPKAVISPTLTPKPYPTYELCEQTNPNFQITFPTEENGLTEPKIVYIPDPTCTKEWYATIEAKAAEEQGAAATALAYMGDKASNLKVTRVSMPQVTSDYVVHLRQTYHGIPIDSSSIIVTVDPNKPPESRGVYFEHVSLPSITPTITRDEVVPIAANRIGIQGDYTILSKPWLVIDEVPSSFKYGIYILEWRVALKTDCPLDEWFVEINAYTGDVLRLKDITRWGPNPPDDRNCPTPQPVPRPTRIPAP